VNSEGEEEVGKTSMTYVYDGAESSLSAVGSCSRCSSSLKRDLLSLDLSTQAGTGEAFRDETTQRVAIRSHEALLCEQPKEVLKIRESLSLQVDLG
jgi:hypothetical protein